QIHELANKSAGVDQQATDADTALRGANPARDLSVDLETASGREHDARGHRLSAKGERDGLGPDLAGVLEVFLFPKLLEIFGVRSGERRGIEDDDVVLHQSESVVGHVGRAGPD